MGVARNRGTRASRISQATNASGNERAPAITCNVCQVNLDKVETFDSSALKGIDAAFSAHCAACDQDTWAVRGQPVAVQAFYSALEKAAGAKVKLGTAKNPNSH